MSKNNLTFVIYFVSCVIPNVSIKKAIKKSLDLTNRSIKTDATTKCLSAIKQMVSYLNKLLSG